MGDMRSVIRGVMLDSDPAEPAPKGVIAGRIVPTPARRLPDRAAWVRAAAAVLPAVVLGLAIWRGFALVQAPAATPVVAEPSPVVVERVVEVQVIVTATPVEQGPGARGQGLAPSPQPPAPAQVAPRQVAPQVQAQPQALPQAPRQAPPAPQAQPRAANVQRPAASVQVQAAPTVKPTATLHERILSRNCQFPDAPQGTVIRGYYTDKDGRPRDAICKLDGWKAVD